MRVAILLTSLMVLGVFAGCFGDKAPDKPAPKFTVLALEEVDSFRFDASASKSQSATYTWDFGDKTNASGEVVDHTYEYTNGVYNVELCITDADADETCVTQEVTVGTGENKLPEAHFTRSLPRAGLGEPITFDASTSVDKDGDPLTYVWDFNDPIEVPDYNAFREAAGAGGEGGGDDQEDPPAEDETEMNPQSTGGAEKPKLPAVPVPVRPMSGDHGPSGPERNVFYSASQTTTVPVVTHSYTEPGLYIVRLRAVDIKGGFGDDYWPILIEEEPPSRSFTPANTSGVTMLGTGGQAPAVGDDDPDENFTSLTLPFPAFVLYANLTWEPGQPIGDSSSQNQLKFFATFSDGSEFGPVEDGTGANLDGKASIDGAFDRPAGDVEFHIYGVNGANIAWTLEVYATLDTNPFPDGLIAEAGGHH